MVIRQCKSCQIEPAMDEKSVSYGGGSPCEGLPHSLFVGYGFQEVQKVDKDFSLTTTCFMRILREKPMKRYM